MEEKSNKIENQKAKIKPAKKKGQRNEFLVVTTMLTLANAFCGFTAILNIFTRKPISAGWFIILAILFDALDGSIARLTKTSSRFGIQLDSLCDAVSFALAPAVLFWYICKSEISKEEFISRIIWFIGVIYVTCGLLRLARFNIQTGISPEDHKEFTGLPSPAAAGFIATSAIFIYHNDKLHQIIGTAFFSIYIHLLPVVVAIISILMVSSIKYVHFFSYILHGKKSARRIFEIILLIGLALIKPSLILWLLFLLFIFYPALSSMIRLEKESDQNLQELEETLYRE